jgi:hypothetical protein
MNCDIFGGDTINKIICERCTKIMEGVIREVGPDVRNSIEDCRFIYPMVKRVADGSLGTQDIFERNS